MRNIIFIGWISAVASLASMVIGHLGSHELSWKSSQISTYAAAAPYDFFITGSILLSSLSLLIIGILVSRYQIAGNGFFAHLVPTLSGAAASGLLMLAYYEETAKTLNQLKKSGFWAIRIQSFHDAGLTVFFYSAVLLVILLGSITILHHSTAKIKILGGLVLSMGPLSYLLMTTAWPKLVGFEGMTRGVNQRAALFCLWLAVVLILAMASNKILEPTGKADASGSNSHS